MRSLPNIGFHYIDLSKTDFYEETVHKRRLLKEGGRAGGSPSKQMKWDENKYLVLNKADVVFDHPKKLWKPTRIGIFEYPKKLWNLKIIVT